MSIGEGPEPSAGEPSARDALDILFNNSIAFIVINCSFVALRFYSVLAFRAKRLRLTWDDWLLLPALVFMCGTCASSFFLVHYESLNGATKYTDITDPSQTVPIAAIFFATTQFQAAGYVLTRLSVLYLYLRIFIGRKTRWATYFMIAFVVAQWIAYALAGIFFCWPISYSWTWLRGDPNGGHCGDFTAFYRYTTPPNIASDLVLVAIPLPTIWRLRTSRARKIGLTTIFFSTAIALVGSCVRQWLFSVYDATFLRPAVSNIVITWVVVEPSLYLIVACLPGMYPLLIQLVSPRARREARLERQASHNSQEGLAARTIRRAGLPPPRPPPAAIPGVKDGPFIPLVDGGFGDGGFDVEATGKKATKGLRDSVAFGRGSESPDVLSASDFNDLANGDGLLMTTEISVTQEQKISDVIGFRI